MAVMEIPLARPALGPREEQAVLEVMRSGNLAQGPRVREFEEKFAEITGAEYAIATSSGTAAIHLALLAHGIGAGDEVITSPLTFIATANAIVQSGARPVFVDVDDTLTMDPRAAEAAIGPHTRAIMPVHLHGNPAAVDELKRICDRHGLVLLQDACQAHGALVASRPLGYYSTALYSFYATKNITTGEGGMVTTNDPEVAARCASLRHQGYSPYGPAYAHDVVGYNYRMSEMSAAIGICQLDQLVTVTAARRANARRYDAGLAPTFDRPRIRPGHLHVYHQYVVRMRSQTERDRVSSLLHEAGIGAAVHYPIPVHHQAPYWNGTGNRNGSGHRNGYRNGHTKGLVLEQAERAAADMLSIPVHPGLTPRQVDRIVATLNAIVA